MGVLDGKVILITGAANGNERVQNVTINTVDFSICRWYETYISFK